VFEHEERLFEVADAGVNQLRDVRMREGAENPAFPPEALFPAAGECDADELDRDAPIEPAVAAFRQPHGAHPALSESRTRACMTERLAGGRRLNRPQYDSAFKKPFVRQLALSRQQPLEVGGDVRAVRRIEASHSARSCSVSNSSARSRYGPSACHRSDRLCPCDVRLNDRDAAIRAGRVAPFPSCAERCAPTSGASPRFRRTKTRKKLQVDQFGQQGVGLRELVERVADLGQLTFVGDRSLVRPSQTP
jgi:hypothetical protein